jgi:hypothetical protein
MDLVELVDHKKQLTKDNLNTLVKINKEINVSTQFNLLEEYYNLAHKFSASIIESPDNIMDRVTWIIPVN